MTAEPPDGSASGQLADGTPLVLRAMRAEDEPAMRLFHQTLSEATVRLRWFHQMGLGARVAHARLEQVCRSDRAHALVLVAELPRADGPARIVGVGRLNRAEGTGDAELAVVVADAWHGQHVGTALVRALIDAGRREGLSRLNASMMPDNLGMLRLLLAQGFERVDGDDPTVRRVELVYR